LGVVRGVFALTLPMNCGASASQMRGTMKRRPVLVVSACIAAIQVTQVQGGTIEQATILADPQMQVDKGAIKGCGYRLKSMPASLAGATSTVVLDTSFNLYSSGLALLKGGAVFVPLRTGNPGQPVNRPIASFWIKAQGNKPTTPLQGKVMPAETSGYLLYGESMTAVGVLFNAVWDQEPITVGMRLKGEAIDRIYSGRVVLSEPDGLQGKQCMHELLNQMQSEAEKAAPPR
jgi:hypothetical protein